MNPARNHLTLSRAASRRQTFISSVQSHDRHLQAWIKRVTVAWLMFACALAPVWSAEEETVAGFLLPVREQGVIPDSAPAHVELLSRTKAPRDTLELPLMA